ncbi:MAG: zinc-binding dehydrogenase [Saprospiraceae bacterium]|nr:zinc-binding dehydrogenase [Saprospiraceae bacterium]
MRAILFREINELPKIADIELPSNAGQVTVGIKAAALNHRDIWITKGLYPGLVPNTVMGADGAGLLAGERVVINPGINWGEKEAYQDKNFRVLGVPDHGTFAEFIHIDPKYVYKIPEHLSMEEAAALPVAGVTAYRALMKKCKLNTGEKVLITGLGGGVALMAALMAKAAGALVYFTTGSDEKLQKGLDAGFHFGVNYHMEGYMDVLQHEAGGFDVIIDSAAGEQMAGLIKLCNFGARIAFYGGSQGKINGLNPQQMFWKQITMYGTSMGSDRDFAEMLDFVRLHGIRPMVDSVFPLAQFEKAFSRLQTSAQFGKVVLSI